MIQYQAILNINIPQMRLVYESRKATVEIISKQLEYVTKNCIAINVNNFVLNLQRLYSLVTFNSLVLYLYF